MESYIKVLKWAECCFDETSVFSLLKLQKLSENQQKMCAFYKKARLKALVL